MKIFKTRQSIIIFYLCLLGFPVTSEVMAEPGWTSSRSNHQITKRKFNAQEPVNDRIQWRKTSQTHERESRNENKNKPRNRKDSSESRNSHIEPWQQDKHQSKQHHSTSRDNNNYKDNNFKENNFKDNRQQAGKRQKKSEPPEDYKDRKKPRNLSENERQRRHDTTGNSRYEEHRNHERVRSDRVVVTSNKTHRSQHRPKYNLYRRHQHIYYRTPWYNTYYVAPIHYHFHPIGYRVQALPRTYVRIVVSGLPYFYFGGIYYRSYNSGYVVVSAPIGAVVTTLPVGFLAFSLGAMTYYYVNDAYYVWDEPREGYLVVEKPEGADQAIADATAGRLFVYPKEGQSEEQQARDRYECHRWAVTQTHVDPTLEDATYTNEQRQDYQRAMTACLEGRGYTVK